MHPIPGETGGLRTRRRLLRGHGPLATGREGQGPRAVRSRRQVVRRLRESMEPFDLSFPLHVTPGPRRSGGDPGRDAAPDEAKSKPASGAKERTGEPGRLSEEGRRGTIPSARNDPHRRATCEPRRRPPCAPSPPSQLRPRTEGIRPMWHLPSARGRFTPKRPRSALPRRASRPRLESLESPYGPLRRLRFRPRDRQRHGGTLPRDNAVDAAGNTYVTGILYGTMDLDPAVARADGSDILTPRGTHDVFVAKYAPDNSLDLGPPDGRRPRACHEQ